MSLNLNLKTSLVIFVALIVMNLSLSQLRAQTGKDSSAYEELYDKCQSFIGTLCDFVFGKNPASNVSNSTEVANFSALTYNDKDLGFSIQYPLGWTVDHGDSVFNIAVRFVPPENDADVNIRIFPKGDYKSIYEYGDTFKESNNHYKFLNYYRNSSTTLSDRPAVRAIYLTSYNATLIENKFGNESSTLKEMMVSTLVPERDSIYTISYFTKPPAFNNYLPVVEKMINSFQIYGKGPIIQEDNSTSSNS